MDEGAAQIGLDSAAEELYGSSLATFLDLRKKLAAAARSQGDRDLAKQILTLRKPSRSAHAVNMLIRADSRGWDELDDLARALRSGERSIDADEIANLAGRRRELVEDLTDRALKAAGEEKPTVGMRTEIADTIRAGLADPGVAEQIRQGRLLKAVAWDGYGFVGRPDLSVVGSAEAVVDDSRYIAAPTAKESTTVDSVAHAAEAAATAERKARAAKKKLVIDQAEEALRAAELAKAATEAAADKLRQQVDDLRERLTDAGLALEQAELDAKTAQVQYQRAAQTLRRAKIFEV